MSTTLSMRRCAFVSVVLVAAACGRDTLVDLSVLPTPTTQERIWTNGGFDQDANGTMPPTGWTVTNYQNLGVSGSPTTPPTSFAALNLQNQGTMVNETVVLTGTIGTLSDPDLGTSASFRYPLYGVGTTVVNWLSNATNGNNRNVNVMSQTMTVAAADVDTTDNQVHVRFAAAPVMENPTHSYTDQPYYYIELDNLTTGSTLYTNFNLSGSQGVNWNSAISKVTGNSTLWTNWQLVDIVPGNANLRVGDSVQLSVVAAGCALSGHFGRVYVDGVGSFVPGPYTYANGPEYANANSTITYTFNYANGGGNTAYGTQVSFTTPPNTTFQSVSLGSTQCSTPAVGSAGTVLCPVGTLQPGAGGVFTASVNINPNATGTITNGLYYIQSVGQTALYGNKIITQLTASTQALADANITFGTTVPVANWSQNLSYTFKVDNNGPSNLGTGAVVVTHTIPSQLTNATWSCAVTAGSGPSTTCATSNGSGNISVRPRIASGGELTYTVNANVVAGSGTGTINVTSSASVVSGVVDPETSNNQASFAISLGTPITLALTKTGSTSSGTVASYPTGISCGTTCSSASTQFVSGTAVEFQATPVVGATFVGWSGACTGNSPRCAVTLNSNQTLTANFSAPPPVGPAANVYVYSGSNQYALAGAAFLSPMTAIVLDANGMAVNNASVTFAAPTSGATATMSPNVVTTNAWGLASVSPTASSTSGTYSVKAQVGGAATATFTMYNTGVPKKIIYVGGGISSTYPQTAATNAGFVSPLVAQVLDASNYPIPGQTVTYAPPGSGASASLSSTTVQTDAGGYASVYATANGTSGGPYKVNATVSGVGTAAPFYLTNTTSTAAAIYVVSGTPQLTPASTAFSQYLVASVVDSSGNAIQGVSVTFNVPSSGATATLSPSSTITTNAAGEALVLATANATPGTYTVSASVSGVGTNANFTLTNDGTQYVSVQSGSPQSTAYSSVFPQPLKVLVLDNNGSPVQNANVTFTAPGSGASATFGGSSTKVVQTDPNGNASVTATANATLGSYSVSAAVAAAANPATFALTNAAGGAANCNITSGNHQSALVGTSFANVLSVNVTDGAGHAVSGVTVSFTPPATGPSTTLSSLMVTTDANGNATVSAEAGTVAGTYALGVSVGSVTNSFTLTNTAGSPNAVVVTSGNNQTPTVHAAFPTPLVASAVDAYGNGVSGVAVTFTVVAGGSGASATFTTHTGTSGTSGTVTFTPTANNVAGAYTVTATSAGLVGTTFSVTNVAAAPANLVATSGNNQTATVNNAFTLPLLVTATDTYGNPIVSATATFTAPGSGATAFLSGGTATTDPNGQASVTANANVTAGTYTVNATLGGLTAPFTLTNSAAAAAAATVATGGTQTPVVNANFTSPLQVQVVDTYGNPVSGVLVTFAAPGSGASAQLSSLTATTGVNGVASVTAKANTTAGSYVITATVSGVSGVINFNVTNVAAASASIAVVSGNNQSAVVHTGFGAALVAVVKDTYGNVVPNASVTFTGPGSGAMATFVGSPATTGSNGQASVTATASTVSGAYVVTAATGGASTTFNLTNTAAAAATISVVSGNNQTPTVHGTFGAALVTQVNDIYSNPVPNVAVTYGAPSTGASATLPGGGAATTGSNGQATITPTANNSTGAYSISASAAGVGTGVNFSVTNKAAGVASLTIRGGNNQTPTVHGAFGTALSVQAQDTYGNDVPNASVTFSAPGSGATATFTGNPATADANGNASVTATASTVAGAYTISASSNGVSVTFNVTNQASTPASIAVVSGNNQTSTVNATFGAALVVSVQDTYSNAVPNAQVTFTAPGSGASANLPSGGLSTTGSNGQTSITPTANTTAGAYTITATVAGASGSASFASFLLTNTAGGATAVTIVSGSGQTAPVGKAFASPLVAKVLDSANNPVPGARLTFAAPIHGPSVALSSTGGMTNSLGQVSVNANALTQAGNITVTVTLAGAPPASFTLQAVAGAVATLVPDPGATIMAAMVGTPFVAPLGVTAYDAWNNLVTGASLQYAVPSMGASATLDNDVVTTDPNGHASAQATANTTLGTYTVHVMPQGAGSPTAVFTLNNLSTQPRKITVTSGSPASATVRTAFSVPWGVKLVDNSNVPVPNVTVVYTTPRTGATAALSSPTQQTSSLGTAQITASAGSVAGSYVVTAYATNAAQPALFYATNTQALPASVVANLLSSPQNAQVGTAFKYPLGVTVYDALNNPISNATVTFTAPATGATAQLANVIVATDNTGFASVTVMANATVGTYQVTATVDGVPTAAVFNLGNLLNPPVGVFAAGGDGQSTLVLTPFPLPLSVALEDPSGNPVANNNVTFIAPTSGATAVFTQGPIASDANGNVQLPVTAGSVVGAYAVVAVADSGDAPVLYNLANLQGVPASLSVLAIASPQYTAVDQPFANPLLVMVLDANQNPVSNITVTYTPSVSNTNATASLSDTQAVSGPDGIAWVTAVANGEVGSYTFTASVAGVAQSANFVLNNIAGSATVVTLTSGGSQSISGLTPFTTPVVFQVLDGLGFPVPNAAVQVTAQPSIVTGLPSSAQTDALGNVKLYLTAGSTVGTVTITVSTFGVPSPASATLYVTQIPTTTTLGPLPRMGEGDAFTMSAKVTAPAGSITGLVDFSVDGKVMATGSLDANGNVTATFTSPTVGTHSFVASYRGTALFAPSESDRSSGASKQDWAPGGEGCAATGGSAWLFVAALALAAWRSVGRGGRGGRWSRRDFGLAAWRRAPRLARS